MLDRKIVGVGVLGAVTALSLVGMVACGNEADVANQNIANDADNFNIQRHVKVYNERLDKVVLEVQGFCSVDLDQPTKYSVLCKVGKDAQGHDVFIKHLASRSANTFLFGEQTVPANVSVDHYRVTFNPSTIVPDVKVR